MRIAAVVIAVIWLLIGALAAIQRDYFQDPEASCAEAGNVVITVIAGPLNYVGVNPKITCKVPQPSS